MAGAQIVVQRLLNQLDSIHAVLFYGPEGAGMEGYADELAQGWLCKEQVDGRACGQCPVCNAYKSGRLIDFMRIQPWGPQSLIKLAAMRPERKYKKPDDEAPKPPLLDYFRTAPMMAKRKVVVFEQAHRMTNDAANALLKTLEEPPKFAKVILTTAEFSRVLPTVRSRCMAVACSFEPRTDADEMLRIWGGSPGLDDQIESARAQYQEVWAIFESSLRAPRGAAIALAERCRAAVDPLSKSTGWTARTTQGEVLRCLSAWLFSRRPERPALAQKAIEAHRLVLGNVNAGALFDQLWVEILS